MNAKPILKTILLAAAVSTTSAFAAGSDQPSAARISAPFEQNQFDRTLPNPQGDRTSQNVRGGPTLSAPQASPGATSSTVVAGPATSVSSESTSGWATGVWANDRNFIAPAK